jgi:hypothetical protein
MEGQPIGYYRKVVTHPCVARPMPLALAFWVALLPILTVFLLLVVARRPADQAMPGALAVPVHQP